MRRLRVTFLSFMLLLVGMSVFVSPVSAASGDVCVANVNGIINPAVADYLTRSVKLAEQEQCNALIVKLNTPGGLTSSTWQIGEAFLNANVPIVVYVSPQGANAGSAGVFITYAAHFAAMSPNTNIGAAHPVAGGGEDIGDDLRDKVTNDAVARITTWAKSRGRNVEWAEKAVRQSVSIGSNEALELNVINFVAQDQADLLRQLDGKQVTLANGANVTLATAQAPTRSIDMSWLERLLHFIGDPTIASMLISLGSLGLYFEVANPGFGVSGVLGVISIALGLYGLSVLPVNTVGAVLLVLSLVLFAVDIFATNHGALTFGGIVAFVVGLLLLIDVEQAPGVAVSRAVIAGLALAMLLIVGFIMWFIRRTRLHRPAAGLDSLKGSRVRVKTLIAPEGTVFADGAIWQARSDEPLNVGDEAEIVGRDGLTLIVRRVRGELVRNP